MTGISAVTIVCIAVIIAVMIGISAGSITAVNVCCMNAPTLREDDLVECVLASLKAHIFNVASIDAIIESGDGRRMADALVRQYMTQIADNESQLKTIGGFKSSLYENMVSGILSKEDYKSLKAKYVADETRLNAALDALNQELEDVRAGKGERLKWTENFRRFEGMTELDRRTVANLIQTIRVESKTELQITFAYQAEYEAAIALLGREAA